MAINVTLGEVKTQEPKPFPKLMITNDKSNVKGRIVFFTERKKGICIQTGDWTTSFVGEWYEDWSMEYFTDYNEPITIQNA